MTKIITLTIDDQKVNVPEGTLIVNAAKMVGIDIPVFCYHPKMEPVGMCRQCLVEVGRPVIDRATGQPVIEDGQVKIQFGPKLETACTTVVSEGMVVLTRSEKARQAQKEILEFLLTSHPLDCPVCDKGGECPLQNLTMAFGPSQSRFLYDDKHHAEKHVPLGDKIWLDRERCIQCGRCIRFQEKIAGDPVLAFYQRGRATDIITNSDPPFDSIFSGNTTDICPVGALTTADFRFGARPWEMKAAASICPLCPVGCNIVFNTRREAKSGGKVVIKRVMPRQNEQVNEIWICDRGRFNWHYVEDPTRLAHPLVKKDGKLELASWQEALEATRKHIAGAQIVVVASGRLSNEDLFNLKQLADGLSGQALLYDSLPGGELTTRYGVAAGTNLGDLGAGSAILVAAADLYYEAPIWYLRVKAAAERGANLVIIHPQATRLDKYAKKLIRCEREEVAAKVQELAAELTAAENLIIFFGRTADRRLAETCASLLQGRESKPNNGLIGVWQRANDQGAWELGYKPAADLAKIVEGKVVYLAAADPAGDDPQWAEALKTAKALIVQELFLTETAKLADVVFPAQAFSERDGSYTSGERRVQRFYPATPPLGEARPDFAIAAAVASAAGLEVEGRSALRVMDKIAVSIPAFAGISYGKLAEVTEQWPIVGRGDLYYGGTTYENRQGLGVHLNKHWNIET
ncbi:MAG: NADH-quinone oxidoreductase subunit NuoG [Anaerolineales bacterium]|nr:NADH-quinone oxidoreductase subunit NuoG [Anaerolineales bacterium]MDW8227904.1 NADH-quinone oxidoreductase subunit NuoG [Anaerolineales bacterium]